MFLICVLGKPIDGISQVRFGVQWNPPEDSIEFARQLSILQSLEIAKLQLIPPVSQPQLNRLSTFDFHLYINPPLRFIIGDDPYINSSSLADTLRKFVQKFEPYDKITAIGLLDRSELYDAEFAQTFISIFRDLEAETDKKLFISSAFPELERSAYAGQYSDQAQNERLINTQLVISEADDLAGRQNFFSYIYAPENIAEFKQKQFRAILDSLTSKEEIQEIFISGGWLSQRLNESYDIAELIRLYQQDDQATFEVNETEEGDSTALDWPVFLLIIIFGSFAIHLYYSTIYRRSLFRYFRMHMFFVDDIAKRHIRSSIPGYIILFQHVLSTCIMLYLLFVSILDETGWQVILQYFPSFYSLYNTLPYIIIPSAILALIVESAIILWIYLTNRSVKHLNQVLLLYSWPLQIGIVIAGIALIFQLKDYSSYYILLFGVLFVANWLSSFLIAVFDLSIFARERKNFFIAINSGLFIAIVGLLIYYYITYNVYDVVLLALNLSSG